jgi:hypothetical protein
VGDLNKFSPGASDLGQPTRLFAGLNSAVFDIPLVDPNQKVVWTLNGRQVEINNTLKTCEGRCVDTPLGAIKGDLDQVAIELSGVMNRAAAALASVKDKKGGASEQARDRRDAARATKKASEYETLARSLTIQFPEVAKICPDAPVFCATVDRQGVIAALRGLYANQRNSVKRTTARLIFRSTGATSRRQSLVNQAVSLEQRGAEQLAKIPRFVTECR